MNIVDNLKSFYQNHLSDIPAYWHEQSSLTSGFNELMDMVDDNINQNMCSSSESFQALTGLTMGTARLVGSLPLGLNDWAISTAREAHNGPGKTLYRFFECPIKGFIDGVEFLGNQAKNWTHGSLNSKNSFQVAQELSFTIGTGLLMFLGARNLTRGGGSINFEMPSLQIGPQVAGIMALRSTPAIIPIPDIISIGLLAMTEKPPTINELIDLHDNTLSIEERIALQERLKLLKDTTLDDFYRIYVPIKLGPLLESMYNVTNVINHLRAFNALGIDDWVYFKAKNGMTMKIRISFKGKLRIPVGIQLREL